MTRSMDLVETDDDRPDEAEGGAVAAAAESDADHYRSWPYVDRRTTPDRRAKATSFWESLLMRGRRRRGRRWGEDRNIYVDVYERREIGLVVLVLVLNVLDAYFTLDYIDKGGSEANPVAQGLLDLGNTYFIYAKSVLVGLCLVFLLVHKKFSYVNLALGILTTFYSLLLGYHVFLQARFYLRN